ncbi:hypothetical protein PsYK624_052310 [Phanerochaete sordida]|uniref:Uncharacterized protein n=1 Tax=Phanerochaete sordida TaxID=48140 RepID=A0A9P3G4S0_9APHY|nr:hypothetical protein PsYK624_052310 [Phanerochaete sordida]
MPPFSLPLQGAHSPPPPPSAVPTKATVLSTAPSALHRNSGPVHASVTSPQPSACPTGTAASTSALGITSPGDEARDAEERAVSAYRAPDAPRGREYAGFWRGKCSVSAEHSGSWARTKQRVELVTAALLGSEVVDTALDGARGTLGIGQGFDKCAPGAGLAEAARVLASIWEAVQVVQVNRPQCLHLTERCADVLLAVKDEIEHAKQLEARSGTPQLGTPRRRQPSSCLADGSVERRPEEASTESVPLRSLENRLWAPLERLTEAFRRIRDLFDRHSQRSFLTRYRRHGDILRDIQRCEAALDDARNAFEVSVRVRVLAQVVQQRAIMNADVTMERIRHWPRYALDRSPSSQPSQIYATTIGALPAPGGHPFRFPDYETRNASSGDDCSILSLGADAFQTAVPDSPNPGLAPIDVPDQHPVDIPAHAHAVLPACPEAEPESRRASLSYVSAPATAHASHDTLDREFLESARASLVRLPPRAHLPVLPPDVKGVEQSFVTGSYAAAHVSTPR